MARLRDFYEILGIPRNADEDAIKSAYRRLVKRLHPDVSGNEPNDAFREVQSAFETLSDLERRRRYDATLSRPQARPAGRRVDRACLDTRGLIEWGREGALGEILLTPDEAAAGGLLPLDIPLHLACPTCSGFGGFLSACPMCQGDGEIERRVPCVLELPPGVRDGTVFQIRLERPAPLTLLVSVSVLPY
jgi:molecular chaperone DnaJ